MTTFVSIYIGIDTGVEAHRHDGIVRFIEGGQTIAVVTPSGTDEQIAEACDRVINAFMDLRGKSVNRLILANAARLQEAVPEGEEPPLCPCRQGYRGHDARPLTEDPYPPRHVDVAWDQMPKEAGHGQSNRQGG